MPSNAVWLCFACRRARRLPKTTPGAVLCIACGNPCTGIGYKIPVPRRDNAKAWKRLHAQLQHGDVATAIAADRKALRQRNRLEKQIRALQSRPPSPERARRIRDLQRQKWPR